MLKRDGVLTSRVLFENSVTVGVSISVLFVARPVGGKGSVATLAVSYVSCGSSEIYELDVARRNMLMSDACLDSLVSGVFGVFIYALRIFKSRPTFS